MSAKKKVVLVDDHDLFCEGLSKLFSYQERFEILEIAKDGLQGIKKVEDLLPDIVIMDIGLPQIDGIKATRLIKEKFPDITVIILTMHKEYLIEAMKAGANAYILKNISFKEMLNIIESVSDRKCAIYPLDLGEEFFKLDHAKSQKHKLTKREIEILTLVTRGLQNKEIADQLSVQISTVRNHLQNIFRKLKCFNRTEAVFTAIKHEIIKVNL